MKKLLSLVVVALVVWAAGLLYAGNKTEKVIRQYVIKINKVYQSAYPGIELKIVKFDSNFLDAKVQYAIQFDIRKLLKISNFETDKKDFSKLEKAFEEPFIIHQNIQYGPIFLKGGKVEFAMAKTNYHSTLNNFIRVIVSEMLPHFQTEIENNNKKLNEFISGLNQTLEKEITLDFNSTLPFFSNERKTKSVISEIRINKGGSLFVIDKVTLDSVDSLQDLTGHGNFNIPNITFKGKDGQTISIKNLSVIYEMNEVIDVFNAFGHIKFSMQKLDFNLLEGSNVSLITDILIELSKNEIPNLSDSKMSIKLEILKYPEQAKVIPYDLPRTIQLSWSLNGIDNAEFTEISRKFQNYLSVKDNLKKDKLPVYFINDIASNFDRAFVKNVSNFNIGIDITTTRQPSVHNTLNFNIIYDFDKGEFKKLLAMVGNSSSAEFIQFIQDKLNASLDFKVNSKILKEFEPILQAPIKQGLIVKKYDFYQADINYKQGKLMVNDNDMIDFLKQIKTK